MILAEPGGVGAALGFAKSSESGVRNEVGEVGDLPSEPDGRVVLVLDRGDSNDGFAPELGGDNVLGEGGTGSIGAK